VKLLLFVHTDPRKTNRSATVRVQKGDYKIESNQKDSVLEVVWEDSKKMIKDGSEINLLSPTNLYINIVESGTEPHLTIYLGKYNGS